MGGEELLSIDPAELEFPFELKKQISVSFQLSNKTDHHIAFKVKTTNPKKYSVRPNNGVVLPRSTSNVVVTMQAQREAPPDMQCKDRFLVQSVVARPGATPKDINPEMFNKETGNHVEDCKLRVVYVSPPKPPSPVPEESEEGSPPRASESENGHFNTSELDAVSGEHVDVRDSSTEARALFSKLNEEKNVAMQQNNKLRQELVNNTKYGMYVAQQDSLNLASDLVSLGRFAAIVGSGCVAVFETMIFLRNGGPKISSGFENELLKRGSARGSNGLPLLYVVLIGLLGILLGYLMKKNS